jgi:hypothetical protein
MYDVELIAGDLWRSGYLYRSASEYYLTDTFTRGPAKVSTAEKVTLPYY